VLHPPLLSLLLCLTLAACGGGGGSSPTVSADPPSGSDLPDSSPPSPPPDSEIPPPTANNLLTEIVGNLQAPRDIIFGPADSELSDELFVVNFVGVEATWVRNFATDSPRLQPIQNSLVGAIAVDIDQSGRFFFACLTPIMGSNIGVVTVRRFDSSVDDFQYRGVSGPIGLALGPQGGLYVANRDARSVTRIDFADGASPDGHLFDTVAQDLQFDDGELPAHLLVNPDGRLFICETAANRIQTWTEEDGLQLFATSDQKLNRPVGIARRPNGNLLITNHGDGRIVELNSQGALQNSFDTGLGADQLYGIAVRTDGQVYVVADRDGDGTLYRMELE